MGLMCKCRSRTMRAFARGGFRLRSGSSTRAAPLLLLKLLLVQAATAAPAPTCGPGMYRVGSSCEFCPVNTYAPSDEMVQCIPCPQDSSTLGVTGGSSVTSCACKAGLYLNSSAFTCASCPEPASEFSCPGGLTENNEDEVCETFTDFSSGWWRPIDSSWPAVYQRCFVASACTGPCGNCLKGHTGPLCQMCSEGLTRDLLSPTDSCVSCPPAWRTALLVIGLLGVLLLLASLVSLTLECEAEQRLEVVTNRIRLTPTLKQLLFFITVWSAFGHMSRAIGSENSLIQVYLDPSTSVVSEARPREGWYLSYRNLASQAFTFFCALSAPDCWSSSWTSPLYAYVVISFLFPIVSMGLYFGACSAYFCMQRNRVPVDTRVLLLLRGNVWRDLVGQKTSIAFSRLCLITLYLWGPVASTYFTATLACRELAGGVSVMAYDPSLPCGGPAMSYSAQLAMPGLLLYAVGFPLVCCLTALFLHARLETPRILKCLGFFTDFFSPKSFWWEGLRIAALQSCVCAALTVKSVSPVLIASTVVSVYCMLVLFFKPYGSESIASWAPFAHRRGFVRHIRVPLTLHAREVAICVFLLLGMDFHVFSRITTDTFAASLEVLTVVSFSLGQLVLLLFLFHEAYRVCRFYWERTQKRKLKQKGEGEGDSLLDQPIMGRRQGGAAPPSHKFFRSDERFFLDAVRIAPFPAEALAQLHALAGLPDLASFDVTDAASWIFDQGHIEIQGQTLYVCVSRIAAMYADLTYDISTSEAFGVEIKNLVMAVARTLNLEEEVEHRRCVAARVLSTYGSQKLIANKRLTAAAAANLQEQREKEAGEDWRKVLGVSTDADAALKWLQLQMKQVDRDPALWRAAFIAVFPDAGSVEVQESHIELLPTPREPPGILRRAWYLLVGEPPEPLPRKIADPLQVWIHPIKATEYIHRLQREGEEY